ncbi:MAG TPA: DUF5947 family protein, partial [Kofleriaceae bacterium]|nr:DUF5947 family protein [Kofleriaceae bacterium]
MIDLRALARLAAAPPVPTAEERCELCGAAIGAAHRHVVEAGARAVLCACPACALLFVQPDPGARFRTVPDRVRSDPAFALTADRWAGLGVPVGLAFCVRDAARGAVTISYPGPAGVVDAELEPDVEALLLRRAAAGAALTCYLVPITSAYELVARLRQTWRGWSG